MNGVNDGVPICVSFLLVFSAGCTLNRCMPICDRCGVMMPQSNVLMHGLRCKGTGPSSPQTRDASSSTASGQAQSSAAAPALQQPHQASSGNRTTERLRCRISSDVEELALLHEVYGWVPGREHVRPTAAVRAQKELLLSNLGSMWASPADWVFHHVFGAQTCRGSDGKRTATRPAAGSIVFAHNPFPYCVPQGTEHWVFWMASPEAGWPEDRIMSAIAEAVDERGGGEFVWYPNPKMSVPDATLFHVQVFWRPDHPERIQAQKLG